jgi:hypothetical protein
MNASDILTAYKLAEGATKVWNEIWHGGKDFLGEVNIQDSSGCFWEVKIRNTGHRGRYLKLKSKSGSKGKMRASADNYKPEEYLSITPDEWEVFFLLANDSKDRKLYVGAKSILDRLVR